MLFSVRRGTLLWVIPCNFYSGIKFIFCLLSKTLSGPHSPSGPGCRPVDSQSRALKGLGSADGPGGWGPGPSLPGEEPWTPCAGEIGEIPFLPFRGDFRPQLWIVRACARG